MTDPQRAEDLSARVTRAPRKRASVALLALALLAACGAFDTAPKPAPTPSVVQGPGKKTISVADDAAGASIVLEPAQELVVSLAFDPASGREWRLVDPKPGVLELRGVRFERAHRDAKDEGSAGATVWRFVAQAPGSAALSFELRRPRNVEPATRTVSYSVTVK